MDSSKESSNISSAEMTALWRSSYSISCDSLSSSLATPEGLVLAKEFQRRYNYPLVDRKIAIRARFFLDFACQLLSSSKYDSCISFASGFSLLSYYVLLASKKTHANIKVVDTDLEEIVSERTSRIGSILDENVRSILKQINMQVLDLENAAKEKRSLKSIFPECASPVFLIEGVIYFLTPTCVEWLFNEMGTYENSAIILDYWPEEGVNKSKCFAAAVVDLQGFMKEKVVSFFESGFWGGEHLSKLTNRFDVFKDTPLKDYEADLMKQTNETPMLVNQDEFFPVQLLVGQASPKCKL